MVNASNWVVLYFARVHLSCSFWSYAGRLYGKVMP